MCQRPLHHVVVEQALARCRGHAVYDQHLQHPTQDGLTADLRVVLEARYVAEPCRKVWRLLQVGDEFEAMRWLPVNTTGCVFSQCDGIMSLQTILAHLSSP
jgi:hypothetical protein